MHSECGTRVSVRTLEVVARLYGSALCTPLNAPSTNYFSIVCFLRTQFESTLVVSASVFALVGMSGLFGLIALPDEVRSASRFMIANAVIRCACVCCF